MSYVSHCHEAGNDVHVAGLIAVVDDDAAMRQSIERLLNARGYTVTTFDSAEDFLDRAHLDSVKGLVLDIHLGGMSGFELRRRLSVAKSTIPVVFITAYDDDATRNEALGVGCVDCLLKPFAAERLTEALERGMKL
jgi:FixJ family two-component response regulator